MEKKGKTGLDIDREYVEKIKPRAMLKGTPTEAIRTWAVLAHPVMELMGPSPFGFDGDRYLWLHYDALEKLYDMCDAIDAMFEEGRQAND